MSTNPTTWVFNQDMLRIALDAWLASPEAVTASGSIENLISAFLNSPEAKKLRVQSGKENVATG